MPGPEVDAKKASHKVCAVCSCVVLCGTAEQRFCAVGAGRQVNVGHTPCIHLQILNGTEGSGLSDVLPEEDTGAKLGLLTKTRAVGRSISRVLQANSDERDGKILSTVLFQILMKLLECIRI